MQKDKIYIKKSIQKNRKTNTIRTQLESQPKFMPQTFNFLKINYQTNYNGSEQNKNNQIKKLTNCEAYVIEI